MKTVKISNLACTSLTLVVSTTRDINLRKCLHCAATCQDSSIIFARWPGANSRTCGDGKLKSWLPLSGQCWKHDQKKKQQKLVISIIVAGHWHDCPHQRTLEHTHKGAAPANIYFCHIHSGPVFQDLSKIILVAASGLSRWDKSISAHAAKFFSLTLCTGSVVFADWLLE